MVHLTAVTRLALRKDYAITLDDSVKLAWSQSRCHLGDGSGVRRSFVPYIHVFTLELAKTSACLDSLARSRLGRRDLLTVEVRHEAGIAGTNKLARAAERVDLTRTAKELLATRGRGRVQDSEQATSSRSILDRCSHARERVAFSKDLSASGNLEGVAAVVLPVVVDGVQDGVAGNLRSATRSTVDVVALEGNTILSAGEVESPVLVVVACGRPVRQTINLVVGDGNATGSNFAENDVLAADQRCLRNGVSRRVV
jgi:hypothetical protein